VLFTPGTKNGEFYSSATNDKRYLVNMQHDLSNLYMNALVSMLIIDTEYYIDLCKTYGDKSQKQLLENKIGLILAELKSRID